MSLLAALAFATPIFGFSLTPPSASLAPAPGSMLDMPFFAQLDGGMESEDQAPPPASEEVTEEEATAEEPAPVEEEPVEETAEEEEAEPEGPAHIESPTPPNQLGAQIRQRNEIAGIHRAFGIATWGSMLVTVVLGFIQYYNLYGFFGSREDTPCVAGGAVFGQSQCWDAPWAHRIAALTTTALYTTTFILSFTMPDPLDAAEGDAGADLRLHKDLRWVHLGGMIAQVLLGFAVGQNWFGLDRANDFEAQQALATVHQVIGLATFGVLTAAGLIMLF